MTDFTDEEGYGKFLDLHECYEKYLNIRGVEVRQCFIFYVISLLETLEYT